MPSTPYTASLFVLTGGIDRRGNPVKLYSLSALHRNTQLSSGLSAISSIYSALNDEWNLVCPVEGRMSADTVPGSYTRDANDHYIFNLSFTFATVKKL